MFETRLKEVVGYNVSLGPDVTSKGCQRPEEKEIVGGLLSECMTDEEPEDPSKKKLPVPKLNDKVVQLKPKLDGYDEKNSDKQEDSRSTYRP